jgi:hypothetical protein
MTPPFSMSKWNEGKAVALQPWTDRLYSLQLEAAIEPFRAGQASREDAGSAMQAGVQGRGVTF